MIAIGTENLSNLVYSGLFNLKEFIKNHTEIEYIETSLEYDNDILLRKHIPPTTKVLSKISYLKDLDVTVDFNRLALGIDQERLIVLLDASGFDWSGEENKKEVEKIIGKYKIGLYNVTNLGQVLEFSEIYTPDFIELSLNPLLFPKTIPDYAKKENITIISRDIFGGKYWAGYIQSMFPKGFLYDFAKYNTDIQLISGEDLYFLSEISRRKVKIENPKLYTYSKDLNKLPALSIPPQKIHGYTTLEIPGVGEITVNGGYNSDTYTLENKNPEIKVEDIFWEDKDTEGINEKLLGCFHRYHAPVALDEKYNPKWWKKVYTKISVDFWVIKLIPRHWWIPKEHIFWLVSGKLIKIPSRTHQNLINENINI